MRIEIINTGHELMLGHVLNTHQQWLCRQLSDHGYAVNQQVAVDDSGPAILEAVRGALARSDLVITTGGLGPTSDDRTRDLIAGLLGRPLREDPTVVAHVAEFFAARKRRMPASTRVQALVPEGAVVLMNAHGTAPGLVLEAVSGGTAGRAALLVMLPGPPRELRPMFLDQVLPLIERRFPLEVEFACRILKSTGLGESMVEERIAGPLGSLMQAGLEVGYCARVGEVDVRLIARGPQAAARVAQAEGIVRGQIGEYVFGVQDDQLEAVIVRLLAERSRTLVLAESCTGGYIAHRLTNVPGASAVFRGGWVTYSNQAKERLIGVNAATLAAHGAVSRETAAEMALGARVRLGADYALSVTGIAGPTGGTAEKPVGTVWIGLATARGVEAKRFFNPVDRETFKFVTSQQAFDLLRRELLAHPCGGVQTCNQQP